MIVYSAEPGSEAADKLAMLRVIGLQEINPQEITPDKATTRR